MTFKVTYDGNGNTSGQAPVDNNSYNAGDTVCVLTPDGSPMPCLPTSTNTVAANTVAGKLARAGGSFAYWNTKPDGTGTLFYWPGGATSFQINSDVTIYAAWYITDGLKNGGQSNGGINPHYTFAYDSAFQKTALNPTGLEPDRTNQLIDACEADYQIMSNWFGGNLTLATPLTVYIANRSFGATVGGSLIVLGMGGSDSKSLRFVLVAEIVELFMAAQNQGWYGGGNEQSCGEGLSRFLSQQFLVATGLGVSMPGFEISFVWLNSSLPNGQNGSKQLGGQLTTLTNSIDNAMPSFPVDSDVSVL